MHSKYIIQNNTVFNFHSSSCYNYINVEHLAKEQTFHLAKKQRKSGGTGLEEVKYERKKRNISKSIIINVFCNCWMCKLNQYTK